ncbi:MAG: D-inositol-3-phosphate glycosyltransferase [bacterium]|nr:D-inositol-3-phosphate glycosyltransferase [bacterium]
MRILYSLPAIVMCGGVVHFFQVAKRLARKGHLVTIQAPRIEDLGMLPELPDSVRVIPLRKVTSNLYTLPSEGAPLAFLRGFRDLTWGIRNIARQIPPDTEIIHSGFHPNTEAAHLARKKGWWRGRILEGMHMDPETFLVESYRKRYAWLFKDSPRKADHILTVCEPLKERLSRYGVPVTNVRNGVDPIFLETPPAGARRQFPGFVLYSGAISRRKGIDTLLEAFARLRDRFPGLRLVLTGRGSWEQFYRGLAERLGVLSAVDYRGVVTPAELISLMDACSVFAFPSWSEGFGLPPLEAMARGCAVVTTPTEGSLQYVRDGKNCLLIQPGDTHGLAESIGAILGNPDLARSLGEEGRATAVGYTWDKVADRTEAAMLVEWEQIAR